MRILIVDNDGNPIPEDHSLAELSSSLACHVLTTIAQAAFPTTLPSGRREVSVSSEMADAVRRMLTHLNERTCGAVRLLCRALADERMTSVAWDELTLAHLATVLERISDSHMLRLVRDLVPGASEYTADAVSPPLALPVPSSLPGLPTRELGEGSSYPPGYSGPSLPGFQRGHVDLGPQFPRSGHTGLDSVETKHFNFEHLDDGLASTHAEPNFESVPTFDDGGSKDVGVQEFSDADSMTFEFELDAAGYELAGAEPPPTVESMPAPTGTRFVNSLIEGYDENRGLTPGETYRLSIGVDSQKLPESHGGGPVPDNESGGDIEVEVLLSSNEFDIKKPTGSFTLPATGASEKVRFEIVPRSSGMGSIRVVLLANHNLLQTYTLSLKVGEAAVPIVASQVLGRDLDAAQHLGPRDIQLIIEQDDNGYEISYLRPVFSRARLPVTPTLIDASLAKLRDVLEGLIAERDEQWKAPLQDDLALSPEQSQAVLRKLATAGNELFLEVFFPDDRGRDLEDMIREFIANTSQPGQVIQVASPDFPIPWGLLYPALDFDASKATWDGFLGMSHVIEQLPLQQIRRTSGRYIKRDGPLAVSVNVNQDIDDQFDKALVGPQLEYWEAVADDRTSVTFRKNAEEFLRALRDAQTPDQIMYLYCHAVTADLADKSSKEATHLLFGGEEKVTLEQLRSKGSTTTPFARNPLVFVNACQSVKMFPTHRSGFVTYFMAKGARGVIGTECSAPALFAADWAKEFFNRFLEGESVGQIVLKLRQEYCNKHGNPLGLIYSVYCDCDTAIK